MTKRFSSKASGGFLLAVMSLAMASVGCGKDVPQPNLKISEDGTTSHNTDFGRVALSKSKTKTFILTNSGELDATLGTIDSASLSLAAPFTLTGGTCITGTVVTVGGSCTLEVTFAPQSVGYKKDEIELTVVAEPTEDSEGYEVTATRFLEGTGYLDCSVTPELQARYNDGASAAGVQNAEDAARGRAAGEALTYQDGYNAGYASGYNAGYNEGYDNRYPVGYDIGYSIGYSEGINDVGSCNAGASAGDSDGYNDGSSDGATAGYNDGYDDGYANGYNNGYSVGYNDGANSCSGEAPAAPKKATPVKTTAKKVSVAAGGDPWNTPENLAACYDQGWDAVFDPNAYLNAYNQAAANNVQYQAGISAGFPVGRSDGRNDGEIDGYNQGRIDGEVDGFAAGSDQAYSDCYYDAYDAAYSDGFSYGYSSSYNPGYYAGDSDGYTDGYNAGYSAGEYDYCTAGAQASGAPSMTTARKTVLALKYKPSNYRLKSFGLGQKWRVEKRGIVVSKAVSTQLPKLKKASAARLAKSAEVRKKAKLEVPKLKRKALGAAVRRTAQSTLKAKELKK